MYYSNADINTQNKETKIENLIAEDNITINDDYQFNKTNIGADALKIGDEGEKLGAMEYERRNVLVYLTSA